MSEKAFREWEEKKNLQKRIAKENEIRNSRKQDDHKKKLLEFFYKKVRKN